MKLATLCYVKKKGKTLLLHRNKNPKDFHYGRYIGLGGKIEEGESPEHCVIREVSEESGLTVKNPRLRGIATFDNQGRKFSDDKPQESWYVFIYTTEEFDGELSETKAGILEWIADSQLGKLNMYEGDKIFVQWLDQPKIFSARFVYNGDKLVRHEVQFY